MRFFLFDLSEIKLVGLHKNMILVDAVILNAVHMTKPEIEAASRSLVPWHGYEGASMSRAQDQGWQMTYKQDESM